MTLKQAEKQASARLAIYQMELLPLYRQRNKFQNALDLLRENYWSKEDLDEESIDEVNSLIELEKPLNCAYALERVILDELNRLAPEIERLEKILDGMQRQYSYLPYCYA